MDHEHIAMDPEGPLVQVAGPTAKRLPDRPPAQAAQAPTADRTAARPHMPTQGQARAAARSAAKARAKLAEDIERLCADAGVSLSALARAAGVPHGYLSRIMSGKAAPTIETYAKLATPLGADLATRLYPNTGPTIRDRHQARILEALLAELHPRWRPHVEVPVWKPARGSIDLVLLEERQRAIVAIEIESHLRRLEQIIGWSREKADALPSWSRWPSIEVAAGVAPPISQLLVVRRTRANHDVVREFSRQLVVAYPAHPDDAVTALVGTEPWPGPALVWAAIEPGAVRLLRRR
jgi:transcriptional regulator with XRE-family HTH domain